MASSAPPPGGPPRPEFRDVISQLARQARDEDRQAEEQALKRQTRRPINRFVKIAAALIGLELLSLGILYTQRREQVTTKLPPPNRILSQNNCASAVYRTYWKVVAYMKDNEHPPATLDDLVPKYLDKVPFDPATGKPLEYSTSGSRFDLHCAGQPARK